MGLAGMVRVRVGSWVKYCVYESPYKDSKMQMYVSVVVGRPFLCVLGLSGSVDSICVHSR